jgi:hypothetical protein
MAMVRPTIIPQDSTHLRGKSSVTDGLRLIEPKRQLLNRYFWSIQESDDSGLFP